VATTAGKFNVQFKATYAGGASDLYRKVEREVLEAV